MKINRTIIPILFYIIRFLKCDEPYNGQSKYYKQSDKFCGASKKGIAEDGKPNCGVSYLTF